MRFIISLEQLGTINIRYIYNSVDSPLLADGLVIGRLTDEDINERDTSTRCSSFCINFNLRCLFSYLI